MQSRFRGFSVPREQAKETYSGSIRRLRFAGTTRRIAPKGLPKREPEYDEPRRKGKEPHPAQTGSALLTKGLQNLPHSFGKECIRKGFQNEGQPVNAMFFWLTGILSSFLDNAPTYLVFFNTAGGDAVHLMTDWTETLSAISAGAVFMGAVTYIGNAPNFMVRSIAEDQGVKMPSFFGYMLWSVGILFPCFALITYLFFM